MIRGCQAASFLLKRHNAIVQWSKQAIYEWKLWNTWDSPLEWTGGDGLRGCWEGRLPPAHTALQPCITAPLDMATAQNGLPATDAVSYYGCTKAKRRVHFQD